MKKDRESNIELLRILLLLIICFWHVIVHGYKFAFMKETGIPLNAEWLDFFASFFCPAVNTFVLISGYFGIHYSKEGLSRFSFQATLFSVITTLIIMLITGCFSGKGLILSFFPIITQRWWFLSIYILLFIFSPILNNGLNKLTTKQLRNILLMYFTVNCIGPLITNVLEGSNFQSLLFVYLLGAYIARLNKENKIKVSSAVCFISYIVSSTLLFTISSLLLKSHHPYRAFGFLSYNNPIIIIQSVALFLSFNQLVIRKNRKINFIAHYVFAAYLIPESFTDILYPLQAKLFDNNFVLGFCSVLIFFFLCILIDYFRERLYLKIKNTKPLAELN